MRSAKFLGSAFALSLAACGVSSASEPLKRGSVHRAKSGEPALALLSWQCSRGVVFAEVVGEIRNLSTQALKDARATVVVYDSGGRIIGADENTMEIDPVPPGERSHFKMLVQVSDLQAAAQCQIDFLKEPKTPVRWIEG